MALISERVPFWAIVSMRRRDSARRAFIASAAGPRRILRGFYASYGRFLLTDLPHVISAVF